MRGVALALLIVIGIWPSTQGVAQEEQRTMLIAKFEGPEGIGSRVADAINIQILRRLRASDGTNDFGSGKLFWTNRHIDPFDSEGAATLAVESLAQLVLWGRAYRSPDGVVVQASLSVSPVLTELTKTRHELWSLSLVETAPNVTLVLDLPRTTYEFAPVAISKEMSSLYDGIFNVPLFADEDLTLPLGEALGEDFTVLEMRSDRAQVRVTSSGTVGWIVISGVLADETQVSLFSGALFRMIRADWGGAGELLDLVLADETLPYQLRIDTMLLRGLVNVREGGSGSDWFQAAYALNPIYEPTCKYLIQGLLSDRERNGAGPAEVQRLMDFASACRDLFAADDPWVMTLFQLRLLS